MHTGLLKRNIKNFHGKYILLILLVSVILIISACTPVTEKPNTSPASPIPSYSLSPSPSLIPSVPPLATPSNSPSPIQSPVNYTYQIINVYHHDLNAFTQGLVYDGGYIYEGTGRYGTSSLRKVHFETGEVLQMEELASQYFGEGITIYKDTIFQLTWKSRLGFIYDQESFDLLRQFYYPTEGWGITYDGKRMIMSDGTSVLQFLNPDNQEITGTLNVLDGNIPVDKLNELEYIKGTIYANVWQTDNIAMINPESGQVTGWIDLSGLLQSQNYSGKVDVLNGIAYDEQSDQLFVTGKLWPFLFEIKLNVK